MRPDGRDRQFGTDDVEPRAELARNRGSSRLSVACMDSINLLWRHDGGCVRQSTISQRRIASLNPAWSGATALILVIWLKNKTARRAYNRGK